MRAIRFLALIFLSSWPFTTCVSAWTWNPVSCASTKLYSTRSTVQNVQQQHTINVHSKDPLVYTVDDFLTPDECQRIQDYVTQLEQSNRTLTRSNPPEISINLAKLWPLTLLSLGAGIPPVVRLLEQSESSSSAATYWNQLLQAAFPNIALALCGSLGLAYGVVLPLIRLQSQSSSRTSDALALNQECDLRLIRPLVDRIVAQTGHAWDHWEAPVVTRYEPGAIFARHGDASPTQGSEWRDMGGQRVITCICYLNAPSSGGETYFDQLGLAVSPRGGNALVFFPADNQTMVADDRTTHESQPPTQEKWILQMFGRAGRVPPPLGLPDSYDGNQAIHQVS